MVLFQADDYIFYATDTTMINNVIDSLKDKFLLEREEDMARFLGLQIERDKSDGTVTLTQSGLIGKFCEAMEMENSNLKYDPADKTTLNKNLTGISCCEDWDYRSVAGILLYLTYSTRPDILYAVHQYAQFSHSSKASHENKLKLITRF